MKSCFLVIALLMFAEAHAQDCSLSMRVTHAPPRFYEQNGTWKGMQVELTTALLDEAGCKTIFRTSSWSRALLELKSGKLDIMGEMSITPERKKFLNFIGPQADETMVFVVRADTNYQINSLDDFKKIPGKFSLARDSWYGKKIDEKIKSDPEFANKIEYVKTDHIQLERILLGRIFGCVTMRYPAAYRLKTDPAFIGKLKIHSFIINKSWNYWGISKKSVDAKLLARIQAAYDRLKSKGKFEEILDRYR